MTLNPERVTITFDGNPFVAFEDVGVDFAIDEAARSFSIACPERPGDWIAPPGTACQIRANGDLVVDGYTNRYKPKISAKDHRVGIDGRGKGQDIIDSAAVSDTGYWENKTPLDMAKDLDKFGVGITSRLALETEEWMQLYQGETAFEAIERYTRAQGVTPMGLADGSIELTNASVAGRHGTVLVEGYNMLVGDATISDEGQHSETTVKGQARSGSGDANLRIAETAKSAGVKRYRPKIIVAEKHTNIAQAKKRAQQEAARSHGFSVEATLTTQGWRDDGGELWGANKYVYVKSPSLKIDGDMLIKKVSLKQNNGGSTASLSITGATAYGGEAGVNKSNPGWQFS